MKKILFLLVLAFLALQSSAENVEYSRALSAAQNFFNSKLKTGAKLPSVVKMSFVASGRQNVYVFNNESGGFVIISADDRVNPVLGYSPTSKIEATNPAFEWWLDNMEAQIEALPDDLPSLSDWDGKLTVGTPVCQYETAKWGQDAPYNNMCPLIGRNRAVTGCVATGAVIMARYFCWPTKGVGTTSSYTYYSDEAKKNITIPENVLGKTYNWSAMPLKYEKGKYTQEEADQVAQVMYDFGCATQMEYGYDDGSAAYTSFMVRALKNNFSYVSGTSYKRASSYSSASWQSLIEENILNCGPTPYAGYDKSKNAGHFFVFDGYTDDHYVSVNWGWDGSDDGYFKLSALQVDGYDFSGDAEAIIGAVPDYSAVVDVAACTQASFDVVKKALSLVCQASGVKCSVLNSSGKELFSADLTIKEKLTIDMKSYQSGQYFVKLDAKSDSYTLELVL